MSCKEGFELLSRIVAYGIIIVLGQLMISPYVFRLGMVEVFLPIRGQERY